MTLVLLESNNGAFISAELLAQAMNSTGDNLASQTHVYVCGPKAMGNIVLKETKKLGVPASRQHHEAFEFR